MVSLPRNGRFWRRAAAAMGASSFSVAANNSPRLRARSAASTGLWQHTSRSPGKSGESISTRSWVSNSDSCSAPSSTRALILGGTQRADPLQLCWAYLVADTGVGEHAPIAHQAHPGKPEPGLELGDLGLDVWTTDASARLTRNQ